MNRGQRPVGFENRNFLNLHKCNEMEYSKTVLEMLEQFREDRKPRLHDWLQSCAHINEQLAIIMLKKEQMKLSFRFGPDAPEVIEMRKSTIAQLDELSDYYIDLLGKLTGSYERQNMKNHE